MKTKKIIATLMALAICCMPNTSMLIHAEENTSTVVKNYDTAIPDFSRIDNELYKVYTDETELYSATIYYYDGVGYLAGFTCKQPIDWDTDYYMYSIPMKVNNVDVEYILPNAIELSNPAEYVSICYVSIPPTVKEISDNAITLCDGVQTHIVLPKSIKSFRCYYVK